MARPEEDESARPTPCWSDDLHAHRYDSQANRAFYQAALDLLLAGAPKLAGQGVDLGCGTGFSTEVLLARYREVVWQGIDVAEAMLSVARSKPALSGLGFRQASAEALPFPDASVDVVVANFSWHWFGQDAGREVRRVLRPGGWLLATVPLRRFSAASGNRALAHALLADRRQFAHKTSQGLRFEATRALLPGPVHVGRHELHIGQESFADARELLAVLDSRGALSAIFGDRAPATLAASSPLDFTWPFALLHLQVVA
jgi:SAM-dependent methyltransferase